ncbi:hypothetical protein B484DRAFT_449277 [Ochromonadaceae sp. CCMP2298]|nr:hypothetical protein B484DRAFT_449277 [Ochromonadaceae sp. CCMP2298]
MGTGTGTGASAASLLMRLHSSASRKIFGRGSRIGVGMFAEGVERGEQGGGQGGGRKGSTSSHFYESSPSAYYSTLHAEQHESSNLLKQASIAKMKIEAMGQAGSSRGSVRKVRPSTGPSRGRGGSPPSQEHFHAEGVPHRQSAEAIRRRSTLEEEGGRKSRGVAELLRG